MPFLVTWEQPGGHEVERQSFDDLGYAREEAESRAFAWAAEQGATIAKVHNEDGSVLDTLVRG